MMILNKYLQHTTTTNQGRIGASAAERKALSPYHQHHMQTSPSPMKDPRDKSALAQQQMTKSLPREPSDQHQSLQG